VRHRRRRVKLHDEHRQQVSISRRIGNSLRFQGFAFNKLLTLHLSLA